MKRRIFVIIIGVILGVFSWILYVRISRGNVASVAGKLPSEIVTESYTLTPFQPRTDTPTPTNSPTVTSTPMPSPTPTASLTFTPSSTATHSPTPTVTSTPQREAFIEGIKGRWPAFSLDCESRSAVDWAAFFGYTIDEVEFFNALPSSDDPEFGFVGDVHAPWGQTPPYGYGVHAGPVAELLRSYGVKAEARYNITFEALKAELSAGRPVIVWVVGRVGRGTPVVYTSSESREITVARFEHTVILIGYTPLEVTVLDGYWVYSRQVGDFLRSWDVLGNMAVIMGQ